MKHLTLKKWEEHLYMLNETLTYKWWGRHQSRNKRAEHLTLKWWGRPQCQSTLIKYLTFKGWDETSRLRDEKKPHAGEVRRAQGAEQTRVIGDWDPLLSLAMLRRFIVDIKQSNGPSRGMLAGYSLSIKADSKRITKKQRRKDNEKWWRYTMYKKVLLKCYKRKRKRIKEKEKEK